jgi:Short C-terminal domain
MPGLLRGVARTAVIAGTATHVSNNVSRRQARRWADQDAAQYPPQPPPQSYQEPPPAPAAPAESRLDKLKDLGDLKAQGVLTEAEFEAEKARILAS